MKIQQILKDRAINFSNKPAIIYQDNEVSFKELNETVIKIANALKGLGINKSEKIAIYLPNYPQYIYSYFAIFMLGAVAVPLDFMLTEEEIVNFINHSDSNILIAKEKKGVDLSNIKKACPLLKKIILLEHTESDQTKEADHLYWNEVIKDDLSESFPEFSGEDYSSIFYTSGSTGHPKGVLLTYGHLDNPIKCIDHFLKPTDKDSYLCAGVPFSHIGGLDYMLFMLYFGSTLILMDRFNPIESLKNIEKYKATIFCIVPAMFYAILSLKECDRFDLSSLRYAVVFGAPSSQTLLKRFHMLCPKASLRNGWGMTETAAPNTYSPEDVGKLNSIGDFGVDMEVKIVNNEDKTVNVGEQGELLVKGDAVMIGYYKEDELTNQAFTDDGWFKTGDIAKLDNDGLYYIVGRKKDMIKVAGEIVFASEVEGLLQLHPKIQEIAVIGVPDKLRGEALKAFVVLKEKETLSPEELRYFAKEHLAHFKVPQNIEIRNVLPKNRTGKIDKELLTREAVTT